MAALELAASVAEAQSGGKRADPPRGGGALQDALAVALVAFAAVGIFVLGMVVHARVSDGGGGTRAQAQAAASTPTVAANNDPARGPADARVTIIEYADFQCPYCGLFHAQTLPQLLQEYGDRVRFVYRNFPLMALHPYAEKAAEAGECAHEQGAFWQYHDMLYGNQNALDRASLSKYAAAVGLDTGTFDSCLDSGKYAAEVANDERAGVAAGVTGTPAFFINGQLISGAKPYAVFKAAIDAELAKTN